MEAEEKRKSKYRSRRWIVTLWSCIQITLIVVMGYITKDDRFTALAMTLSAIPIAFTSLETVNKWKQAENENVNNS